MPRVRHADASVALAWWCIRAGVAPLGELDDATLYPEVPLPWV